MVFVQTVDKIVGIKPILFRVGQVEVSSYTFFAFSGILIAAFIYYHEARKANQANEFSFLIAIGAFVGSTIGAKILELLINIDHMESSNGLVVFLFSGRTVIGGLIGGTIGVWVTKKMIGLKAKRGNLFAPAIAMGLAVGRIGCFFNGCCYGKPSNMPWAVNFGDGITRHPAQVYESLFMFMMFFVLKFGFKKGKIIPGYLFKILMISYFIFRFLIEFIRVERIAFIGLTYFQIISVAVLLYLIVSEKGLILNQLIDYGKTISTRHRP
jgi:phosphatidylglycerol:prolipoprotein diacylglycerol transferase